MFIKLTFCNTLGDQVKAIKISRIQEVVDHGPDGYCPTSVRIEGTIFDVRESFDEIFGTIAPAKKNETGADILERKRKISKRKREYLSNPLKS